MRGDNESWMRRLLCLGHVSLATVVVFVLVVQVRTQSPGEELTVQGYPGQAAVVRYQGHVLVDVQDLARITSGSLSFDGKHIVLSLAAPDHAKQEGNSESKSGFSRPFMTAAIEAMAAMREWGGTLVVTVQNGYPVGNTMAGNAIVEFQNRAAERVALASAAAATESDYRGLELLKNEFHNAQAWSDSFVRARNSLSAANLSTSPNGINDDEQAKKILQCGQFLAQMFASGNFEDDTVCH